jgi:outer membrane protein, heavy metal efflux system
MRITAFTSLLILISLTPAFAQINPDSLLASYIQESWANHPNLAAMQSMAVAESSRVDMASSWMNPDLRVGLMNLPDTFNLWSDPMTMLQIGVMQQIPFPGKLRAAGKAAQARRASAQVSVEQERQVMASMVTMAFYDLAAALRVRKALEKGQELAQEMVESAALMVSSGMGAQSDILRAQLEVEQWKLKLVANQDEITRQRADLAYALGRSDASGIPEIDLPDHLPDLPDTNTTYDDSPQLRRSLLEVEAANQDLKRARLDYLPDVNVGLTYGIRGDLKPFTMANPMPDPLKQDNMVSLEVSFPIPVFYRGNEASKVQEIGAMLVRNQYDYQKIRLDKRRELEEITSRWKKKNSSYLILDHSVIPTAKELWQSTLNDYKAGKIPIMNLSQAQMSVVMNEMEADMLLADAWGLRGQWLAALGKSPIDAGERK